MFKLQTYDPKLDGPSGSIYRNEYELAESSFVKKLVGPGELVLDVGAHIGYYTVLLSSLVGNEGKVLSFEPDASNFKILSNNLTLNKISNVSAHPFAVSNEEIPKLTTYRCLRNSGDTRCWDKMNCTDCIRSFCSQIVLDNFVEGKVSFAKIDVQGYEAKVIKGMKRIIDESEKISLLVEYSPIDIESAGLSLDEFFGCLNGFDTFLIRKNLYKTNAEYLLSQYRKDRKALDNLLLLKGFKDLSKTPKTFTATVSF